MTSPIKPWNVPHATCSSGCGRAEKAKATVTAASATVDAPM